MIEWVYIIILSLTPISELRGAIPTGIAMGLNPIHVFMLSVIFNALAFFPIYFGLEFFYEHLSKIKFIHNKIENIRKKGHKPMERWGVWGLIPFVAIPLPLTGAWTGTIISWLFDVEWWKAFLIIATGVLIAGIIITLTTLGIINVLW